MATHADQGTNCIFFDSLRTMDIVWTANCLKGFNDVFLSSSPESLILQLFLESIRQLPPDEFHDLKYLLRPPGLV